MCQERNKYVNNVWCMLLSFWPIGVMAVAYIEKPNIYMLVALIVVPLILMYLDKKELNEKEYETPSWLWILFVPGYLYSRGVITPQYKYFKGLAVMSTLIIIVFNLVDAFNGPVGDDAAAKEAYCQSVTEIYQKDKQEVRCLAVNFVNKVADQEYRGIAQLDNGEDVYFTASWSEKEKYQLTLRRGFKL